MDTVKHHKFFTIFQYDKEEEYLSECHKNGLAFQGLGFIGTYIFNKVEPADVTYKLEFTADIKDKETYLQMMEDFGWEYVGDFHQFSYFRIVNQGQNPELFTDYDSKKNHLHRIFWGRAFWVIFFMIFYFMIIDPNNRTQFIVSLALVIPLIFILMGWDYVRLLRKFKSGEGDRHGS